ncbi:hypothetical protein P3X46_025593 [Hevea brasiliensis]|uniref:DUF7722 domain-containing protein n=1 Tax=Hevea brasiliensis TaxID=3981 RepID=A0ABQ9L7V3_HEVBR|nr:uncharacterized protein LOC131173023 [Hevea brasiliensis]KAJ9160168.1 hypothetical protein P3X46_025593 [Hevea brasiliensis]
MVVGGLSMLFKDEERSRKDSRSMSMAAAESAEVKGPVEHIENKSVMMIRTSQEFSGNKTLKIPLHYPSYTKKEYEYMPEWQLDMLLQEYGLPIQGDLGYKRELAISAFVWPEPHSKLIVASPVDSDKGFTSQGKKIKTSSIVEFLCHVLGFA